MIVIGLTDLHGDADALARVRLRERAIDVVLLAGDITNFGGAREMQRMLLAARLLCPAVHAVAGNCDTPEAEAFLAGSGADLKGRRVPCGGIALMGAGRSLPCPGRTPNECSDAALAQALDSCAPACPTGADPSILVVHEPPLDTLNDLASSGGHVGSAAVRRFIERFQPLLCLTGHIHEAAGVDRIGRTAIVNPGPARAGGYMRAVVGDGPPAVEIRRA